jgi:Cu(I)/Ag(I) efflux system membrane fusion protein
MTRARGVVAALAIAGGLAWLMAGCTGRGALPDGSSTHAVGAWRVAVRNDPDPAHSGDNTLTIVARDAAGSPMRGTAEVLIRMEAMGAMPAMENRGTVTSAGPGVFRAAYGLPMGGEWDVTVRLLPEGGAPVEAQYRLSTSVRGLALVGAAAAPGAPATSVAADAADSALGAVTIDPARRQSLGIRTEAVQVRDLAATIRVPGRVSYDEARQAEVTLKFGGFVKSLAASVTGQPVRKGEELFTVYSPELWATQQEYLEAVRAARASQGTPSLAASSNSIAAAARQRLLLWDVAPEDIAAIERAGGPLEALPIRSPSSGTVTEKNVVAGSSFTAGQVLFRIASLDPVWVIASVPQQEAARVREGMAADIGDPYVGGDARHGRVSFVYPSLDSMTRTAEVRISVPNPGNRLQPGTYVDVTLATPTLRRLAVPEAAVLPTGERAVVFVDLGDGRLAPREVQLGVRAGDYYEVRDGLREGEVVVTSGNFLVGSESRLRSATRKW